MCTLQEQIISYMFVRNHDGSLDVPACLSLWFGKSDITDDDIRARFGTYVSNALDGKYSKWQETPMGCLALMILVDQFPRNIYRHTVKMFAGDTIARQLIDTHTHWLQLLSPEECIFMPCLVLTHQENVEDQRKCVDFFKQLEPRLPSELHIFRTIFEEHCHIIEQCGCFPHRDHYYNRTTSTAGQALLDNPKIRFDLPLVCKNGNVQFGHDARKLWRSFHLTLDIVDYIVTLINTPSLMPMSMPMGLLAAVSDTLSPDFAADVRDTFRKFDRNGNGVIELGELSSLLTATTGRTPSEAKLQSFFDQVTCSCFSTGGSCGIALEQFAIVAQLSVQKASQHACARKRFNAFELTRPFAENGNKEAYISLAALSSRMAMIDPLLTSAECKVMFDECDGSGRAAISFQDFYKTMMRIKQIATRARKRLRSRSSKVMKRSSLQLEGTGEQALGPMKRFSNTPVRRYNLRRRA